MSVQYLLGILLGLLAGVMIAMGSILQKTAVNRLVAERREGRFMGNLVRTPLWLAGLAIGHVLATFLILAAQSLIGPALLPALVASGLLILAIASTRLLHEDLKPSEWLGVALLAAGITLVGLSGLEIRRSEVDLLDGKILTRAAIFSAGLALYWGLTWLGALRLRGLARGLLLAVSSGAPYSLSNLWVLPFLITIGPVFSGAADPVYLVTLILSGLILALAVVLGLWETQEAFRYAPANKVLPIQQAPQQIAPILIYVFVYQRTAQGVALEVAIAGVVLILVGGFLLGNRQAEMETNPPDRAQTPGEP
jgi:drug/metabolite transporter (DMT)-like permease